MLPPIPAPLTLSITPPNTTKPKNEKVKKMKNARMKKWMRERAAWLSERVMTPR